MVVCHCRAVNDRRLRTVIDAGATSPEEIARRCGAGGSCGGCRPTIESLIEEQRGARASALAPPQALRTRLAG